MLRLINPSDFLTVLKHRRASLVAVSAVIVGVVVLDFVAPPPLHRASEKSALVLDRNGAWLHSFSTRDGRWRYQVDLDAVDPSFIERLVAVEDKRFFSHIGVDPAAVVRAGTDALRYRQITSGASTITMQTARLLEPRPRNIGSKLIEMLRALQIERRLSKKEILSLYLTLAPYGGNLEGVRAASLAYFDKEPTSLSDAEMALLIALPQAPEARRPDRRGEAARMARARMLDKLAELGFISPERSKEAASEYLPGARKIFPRAAYHATRELARAEPGVVHIRSTIDLSLQTEAERLVREAALATNDEASAAALIIENETMSVRAMVGAAGFDRPGGWIDLTRALRSPGSTLKPFVYGLAFDDGLVGPDTIIDDMPRAFGGYAPENFNRMFRGEVRLREALQHSLNVPAVAVLNVYGVNRFVSQLTASGVRVTSRRRADEGQSLAVALGGAGLTGRDLAVLYAGLANDGVVRPLRWRTDEPTPQEGFRLLSEAAAAQISDVLREAPSLAGRAPAGLIQDAPQVAFKTGTSYGYRDAWAAGHTDYYTIVVWIGRADGAARPGMTGRKAAAPLLFDLFDIVEQNGAAAPRPVERRVVSAAARQRLRAPLRQTPPQIVFPLNGAEIYAESAKRGIALSARGGARGYRWYVDGEAIGEKDGSAIWRPDKTGFYDVVVADARGVTARSKVRIQLDQ